MTRKSRRMMIISASLVSLGLAAALVLVAFQDNIVFFHTPGSLAEAPVDTGTRFRLGGLVKNGSLTAQEGGLTIRFDVIDAASEVPVTYTGLRPALFREGQGVVAEGALDETGLFVAETILAKHDENYMPADVAEAVKGSGQWKGGE